MLLYVNNLTTLSIHNDWTSIHLSPHRIGLDKYLGETFDPMSTALKDRAMFRKCVSELQRIHGVKECQTGAMCANTIEKMKQLLKNRKTKTTVINYNCIVCVCVCESD